MARLPRFYLPGQPLPEGLTMQQNWEEKWRIFKAPFTYFLALPFSSRKRILSAS